MSRRVPELALVAGVLLAGSFAGFALWATGDLHQSLLVGAVALYPFAGWAVRVDDDPTTALPPRAVGAAGLLVGAVVAADVVLQADGTLAPTLLRGAFLAGLATVPPAAYAVGYDRSLGPPPRPALVAAVVAAVGFPLAGAFVGTWYGGVTGVLVGLAGALYAARRGLRPSRRALGGAVVVGAGLGTLTVLVDVTAGLGSAGDDGIAVLAAAVALLLAPAAFFALTVETRQFG